MPVQGEGQRAPSNPVRSPIHIWAGVRAKTQAKNYALLHASILATLCTLCDISDGRNAGHAFMTQYNYRVNGR